MITFDRKTKRFRAANGQFIAPAKIRREIDKAIDLTSRDMRQAAKDLNSGAIDRESWKKRMSELSKTILILSVAVGYGGRKQMSNREWGKVGARVKKQNQYLNNFVRLIEMNQLSPPQIEHRASLYSKEARTGYFDAEREMMQDAGKTLARRLINSKEGCPECAEYASFGFIPIDEMPEWGTLQCGVFCLCSVEYQ